MLSSFFFFKKKISVDGTFTHAAAMAKMDVFAQMEARCEGAVKLSELF